MIVLHFSDTHLGYSNFDSVNDEGINVREQDFYDAFEYVVNRILEIKPDIVIHSGDFFNKPSPTNRAMTFALEQLKRISIANIPFVVIAGNHSTPKTIYTSPILKAFKTIEGVYPIFNQLYEWVEFKNIVVHGLPHINDLQIQNEEIRKIQIHPNKKNILMLHTSLGKNYLMDEYGEQLFPEEWLDLLKQFDYVALGHWHNFQQVKIFDNAWYSGSTERMSDTEISHDKGYCLLDFSKKDRIVPNFVKIPTRNWYKLEIKQCFEKATDEIIAEIMDFTQTVNIEGSIFNLNFYDIKSEQSLELSNSKIKEFFPSVFSLNIKRKSYQEKSFFHQIESGSFDKLNEILVSFIRSKYSQSDQVEALVDKANYYFNQNEKVNP
jgi:exonuclease SbcD